MPHLNNHRRGFTFIELLVVIGILVVISTLVFLIIDPVELFRQARDARRINDLWTMEKAVLYLERVNYPRGVTNTVYISQADGTPTCSVLQSSLPTLVSPWVFSCATGVPQAIDGSGWLPFNLTGFLDVGTLITALPVDPTNEVSQGLYYAYLTASGRFELTAKFEAAKHQGKSQDDGGFDPNRYERGSNLRLWKDATGL